MNCIVIDHKKSDQDEIWCESVEAALETIERCLTHRGEKPDIEIRHDKMDRRRWEKLRELEEGEC